MPKSCCSFGCSNHNMMHPLHFTFHKFPADPDRRERWVNACRRVNPDGTKWRPGKHTVLCSAHFITGKPNQNPDHPDYVPSVFSFDTKALKRGVKKISGFSSAVKRKKMFETPETKRVAFQEKDFTKEPGEKSASGDITRSTPEVVTYPCMPSTPPEMSSSSFDIQEVPVFKLEIGDNETNNDSDNVTCGSRPQEDAVKRALYNEMYLLCNEKREPKTRLKETELKLDDVWLGAGAVEGNNEKCQLYTGVTWDVFLIIFNFLSKFIRSSGLSVEMRDQLFLTLVKLRLNISFEDSELRTGISTIGMNRIFWAWVYLMASKLDFLIHRPGRETVRKTLPREFKEEFPRLTSIIDCFEIFVERPQKKSRKGAQKPSTVEVLIACSPLGSISFISSSWKGSVSDIDVVCHSDLISPEYHLPEDQILVNRKFTLQNEFTFICSAEVIVDKFTKRRSQQSTQDVEASRKVSPVRKHAERLTGLIKKRYTILQGIIPLDLLQSRTNEALKLACIDKILQVCAALINLGDRTVYNKSLEYDCKEGEKDSDDGNRGN